MEEKTCLQCTNFIRYYTIRGAHLSATDIGFCTKSYANGHRRKTDKICDDFELLRIEKARKEKTSLFLSCAAELCRRLSELILLIENNDL